MIKRKLQVILFGILLTFSAVAQSQTTAIENPLLTQLARQFVAALASPGSNTVSPRAKLIAATNAAARSASTPGSRTQAAGALVVGGVVQEISNADQLINALVALAKQPGFDPSTVTIVTAASPNS